MLNSSNNATYYPSSPVPKRVNAYEAVRQAAIPVSLFFKNQTLTTSNVYQASFAIFAGSNEDYQTLTGNTIINSTANIIFKAREYISLGAGFEVKQGATFEAKPEFINCQ